MTRYPVHSSSPWQATDRHGRTWRIDRVRRFNYVVSIDGHVREYRRSFVAAVKCCTGWPLLCSELVFTKVAEVH